MGTIADKLAYTKQAREEIRQAIVDKGVQCPGDAPFCSFDDYISQISGGGATAPIFEMPLSNNLDYTGTLGCTISVTGEDISFIDNAFSATSYSSIKLEFPKSLDECIITVDFKINSTGTPAYPLYRRLLWATGKVSGSVYTALRTEVSYSNSASTNYLNFESNNLDTSPLADGNWHTMTIIKAGKALICSVDNVAFYAANTYSGKVALDTIILSHSSYALNGLIKNLKIYNGALPSKEAPVGRPEVVNFKCFEVTSDTSLICEIYASKGDKILATISVRSALTLPNTLELLNTSEAFDDVGQTLSFAHGIVAETGTQSFTIQQASSARIYVNLIVLRGDFNFSYTGNFYSLCTSTVNKDNTCTPTAKLRNQMLIWGCSAILWSKGSPSGEWRVSPLDMLRVNLDENNTAPRQANFIDLGGASTLHEFWPTPGSICCIDAVEIIPTNTKLPTAALTEEEIKNNYKLDKMRYTL